MAAFACIHLTECERSSSWTVRIEYIWGRTCQWLQGRKLQEAAPVLTFRWVTLVMPLVATFTRTPFSSPSLPSKVPTWANLRLSLFGTTGAIGRRGQFKRCFRASLKKQILY
jgi:hypothetical protein